MIYIIYPCPISFFPLDSFCSQIIFPPYYFAPWKSFNDFHYILMSHIILPLDSFCPCIILPLHIILPPGICFMIYTIYLCPISFSSLIHFAPLSFCPVSFCPLQGNCFMICTIYPCPVSFCPLDWTLWVGLLCFNRMLGQMLRCSDITIVMFLFVLV